MASVQPVNAAIRVIELLQAMNRQPVCSIHWLYQATGMPKPTIVRLMQTLASRNIVRHAPQYGAYMLASEVTSLCSGYHGTPRLVDAGAGPLDAFTEEHRWPVALAVFDHDAMVVRYSTIPHSPLSLHQSTINMRLSLASRALGRVYLAACSPQDRATILKILEGSTDPEDAPAKDGATLAAELDQVAALGYSLRAPGIRPISSTLAVPVYDDGRVAAAIGMTWISSALQVQDAIRRYLEPLRDVSREISANLGKRGSAAIEISDSGKS
ncbi:DNA-binding transcriptional regulator [Achromobacter denitrificans]|uniref:DNA-binding transcriptional regulator n=1 Tax=Achromobacter denitrificans TaxID=32002 RepID=UPI00240E4FB1|nr:DNA-binding transcriptional regulator [Achromobacter denitrificans]MBV2160273.1 DNA-binding transcriptional regulator [Achromobacter denitrificans]MDX3882039.1 DNA-binding transcriptional regulator [Achromobacter sp.]WFC69611.1 DNA-binding transcriptional regulator [Achromobacter denitrificans]